MAHQNEQTPLEKNLTERLAHLPIPIRITQQQPAGGTWYQWDTPQYGTGDCGSFADAVLQAITYQQDHYQQTQKLAATPARHSYDTVETLGDCLDRTRTVRPTPVLYLEFGATSWLKSTDAHERIARSRGIDLSWDAYLEDGQGTDPAGIYLFGTDGKAYRAFDIGEKQ